MEISNIKGTVNLQDGAFIVSYDMTIPYLTFPISIISYCALDYVGFQFNVPPSGSESATSYYALYVGTAGAAVGNFLTQLVCGVVSLGNCPVYSSELSFDCNGLSSFIGCDGTANITNSYKEVLSIPDPYTTTYTNSLGSSLTDYVTFFSTTSNGTLKTGTPTVHRTVPNQYTTTYTNSQGKGVTAVVSYSPVTGSDNFFGTSTYTSYRTVPSAYTTTYTEGSSTKTKLVTYYPTTGSDGYWGTGTSSLDLLPSAYTSIYTSAGHTNTEYISFYISNSNGIFTTVSTTSFLTVPSAYTTLSMSAGQTVTKVVSYYPTTGSNGAFATGTTTSLQTVPSAYTTRSKCIYYNLNQLAWANWNSIR